MKALLQYRGSVKDIYALPGDELLFRFSDRYSIFDWGEMPDAILGKGQALAEMGRHIFEYFQGLGFRTHWLRRGENSNELIVRKVNVPKDLSVYQSKPTNTLIPLEVIYRFGVPKGSSLLKRLKTEPEWLAAGFNRAYREGESFAEIKIDYTTKFEKIDRVLSPTDAKEIAGLDEMEFEELNQTASALANVLRRKFSDLGLELWDGKFEFAFGPEREITLVDSVGLDEIRLTYQQIPLSKELLRQAYAGSAWQLALDDAKLKAGQEFKSYCTQELKQVPQALPSEILEAISDIYGAVDQLLGSSHLTQQEKSHQKIEAALRTLGKIT